MTVVFDLDYTLLDTVAFKEALKEAVTSLGVTPERYEETYKQIVKREGKVYDYDPGVHIEALQEDLGDPGKMAEAKARIDRVLVSTEQYLYPGAVEMVTKYKDAGVRLVLLTFGNEAWQEAKSRYSGLTQLFDRVYAVGKEKTSVLRGIALEDDEVIVVNDNGQEMKEMMAEIDAWRRQEGEKPEEKRTHIPEMHFLLKKGPKPSPADLELRALELDEVEAAIDKEMGLDIPKENQEGRTGRR